MRLGIELQCVEVVVVGYKSIFICVLLIGCVIGFVMVGFVWYGIWRYGLYYDVDLVFRVYFYSDY